jgi:hypothetical protein
MSDILVMFSAFCALGVIPFGIGFAFGWMRRLFMAVADLE